MNKLKISFLLLLLTSYVVFSNSFTYEITKAKEFWIVPISSPNTSNDVSYKMCFRGLHPSTSYILLTDESKINMSEYIDITSMTFMKMFDITNIDVSVSSPDSDNTIIQIELGSFIPDENIDYCITFTSTESLASFTNLKIIAASSSDTNRITYGVIYHYTKFNYYSLENTSGLEINNVSTNNDNSVNLSSSFVATVEFKINLPTNKIVLSSKNLKIRIKLANVNFSSVSITSTAVDENSSLGGAITSFASNMSGGYIYLSDFSEDFLQNRTFNIVFSSLKLTGNSTTGLCLTSDNYTILAEVLWKNTNSVISTHSTALGISCTDYKVTDATIAHVSGLSPLYIHSSFPMIITFKVDESTSNKTVKIVGGNYVNFLGATCRLASTKSGSFCYSDSTDSRILYIKNAAITKNSTFTLYVWIALDKMKTADTFDSSNFSFKMQVTDFTGSGSTYKTFTSKPSINDAVISGDTLVYAASDKRECGTSDDAEGCVIQNLVSENFGNFVLVNDDSGNTETNLDSVSSNSNLLIKFTNKYAANTIYYNWFLEVDSVLTTDKTSNIIYGTHKYFFPPNYTNVSKLTSTEKRFHWKSNYFCTDEAKTYDYSKFIDSSSLPETNALQYNTAKNLSVSDNTASYTTSDSNKVFPFIFTFANIKVEEVDGKSVISLNSACAGYNLEAAPADFENIIKFDFVTLSDTSPTSIYDAFDFIHTFTSKNGLARVNRFLSFLPKKGVFDTESNDTAVTDLVKTVTGYAAEVVGDGICILHLNIPAALNEVFTSSPLISFISGNIEYLDFETMTSYPVNSSTGSAKNTYFIRDTADVVDLQTINLMNTKFGTLTTFYTDYLNSRIEFTVGSDISDYVLPIKCKEFAADGKIKFIINKFTKSSTTYSSGVEFAPAEASPTLYESFLTSTAVKFSFANDKFNFSTYPDTTAVNTAEGGTPGTNSFLVLSNYNINTSSFYITNNEYSTTSAFFDSTNITSGILTTSFSSNSLKFNATTSFKNGYYIYYETKSTSIYTLDSETDVPYYYVVGPDYPAEKYSSAALSNFLVLYDNFGTDDKRYLTKATSISFINSSETIDTISNVISLKIITNGIKTPSDDYANNGADSYICAQVNLTFKDYCNKAEIAYNGNITNTTIYQAINFKGTISGSSSTVITVTDNTTKPSFYMCNIKVTEAAPLKVTNVSLFYGDSNKLYTTAATSESVEAATSINSNNYSSNKVTSYSYDSNQSTYSRLTLNVDLDHEAFRNMQLTISSDVISSLQINENVKTKCEPRFENVNSGGKNKIFDTCVIDFSSGNITVTTQNKILFENLPKNIDISIWPVNVINLSSSSFTVSTTFVGESGTMFPNTENTPSASTAILTTPTICKLSPSISDILPVLPGVKGKFVISLDESNNDTLAKCLEANNNPTINEIMLYFPSDVYGIIKSEAVQCYLNDEEIINCVQENEWIRLRTGISLTEAFTIGIYGFLIPSTDFIPASSTSKFLIKANYLTSSSIATYADGIGSISDSFDRSLFTYPASFKNLAMISQSYTNNSPNTSTTYEVKYAIDDLAGLNSSDFTLSSVSGVKIYVIIPSNLKLTASSDITLSHVAAPEDTETSTDDVTVSYSLDSKSMYGKIISATVTSDFELNMLHRYFILTVTNLSSPYFNTANETTRSDLLEFYFQKDSFYLRTDSNLFTNNSTDALSTSIGEITNRRGLNFVQTTNKYYISYTNSFTITPGTYNFLSMDVKKNGTISDLSKQATISISNTSYFYFPSEETYIVDGLFNSSITVKVGMNCGAIPGKYILYFTHTDSNSDNFEQMQPIQIKIGYSYSTSSIKFYNSNKEEYKTTAINLGINGMTYFFAKATVPSVTAMNITFAKDQSDLSNVPTASAPSKMKILANNTNYVLNSFNAGSSNISTTQKYTAVLDGNNCFSVSSSISFLPNIVIESIDSSLDISSAISFINTSTTSTTTIKRNELRFTFDATAVTGIPTGAMLFCSLYCSERVEPNNAVLTTIPYADDAWYENFYYAYITPTSSYTNTFTNLVRDQTYNLKCLLQSSNSDSASSTYVSTIVKKLVDDSVLQPVKTQTLKCIRISVSEESSTFNTESLKIIQDSFSDNFQTNGCIVVTDKNKSTVANFNLINYTCEQRAEENREGYVDSSASTDTSTSAPTTNTTLRYLQSDNSTSTSEIYMTYCLMQSKTCPNDVTTTKMNSIITDLFEQSSLRRNLAGTSNFVNSLSKASQALYKSYTIMTPDENFDLDDGILSSVDYSDFQITDKMVTVKFSITNSNSDPYRCYWALADIPAGSSSPPTAEQIMSCDSEVLDNICGSSDGVIVYPGTPDKNMYSKTLNSEYFTTGKTYTLWITCREDLLISTVNSTPRAILSVDADLIAEPDPNPSPVECTLSGDETFPACCPSGKFNPENPNICYSKYITFSISLLLFVLFALFN